MNRNDMDPYENKTVFLKTKFGRFFTVKVMTLDRDNLKGIDKFGQNVCISYDEITTIVPTSKDADENRNSTPTSKR